VGKSFHFQITTNGLGLTAEVIELLVRERFSVMLSLDGPPEKSDLHRVDLGGRGVGERVLANARRLVAAQKAAGLRPATVRATMAPGNTSLLAIGAFFEDQGFERTLIGASAGRAHAKGACDLSAKDLTDIEAEVQESMERHLAWIDGRGSRPPGSGLA
jgi:sulfatase maturation enzyme AslB (radical SAM superfamily)